MALNYSSRASATAVIVPVSAYDDINVQAAVACYRTSVRMITQLSCVPIIGEMAVHRGSAKLFQSLAHCGDTWLPDSPQTGHAPRLTIRAHDKTGDPIRDRYRRFFDSALMPSVWHEHVPQAEERIAYATEFTAFRLEQIDEKLGQLIDLMESRATTIRTIACVKVLYGTCVTVDSRAAKGVAYIPDSSFNSIKYVPSLAQVLASSHDLSSGVEEELKSRSSDVRFVQGNQAECASMATAVTPV